MKVKFWMNIVFAVLFVFWAILAVFFSKSLYGLPENLFYWLELFFLIYLAWGYRLKSEHLLYPALSLVALGAILNIFGISFAEQILRVSLVFWLVGIGLSLKELKNV